MRSIYLVQRVKPCPFALELRKLALNFVVVIFFPKCRKKYKLWSDFAISNVQTYVGKIIILKEITD